MSFQFPRKGSPEVVELAFTTLLVIGSGLFIWYGLAVPDPPRNIVVGPRTFPWIVGWAMLVISAILLVGLLRGARGGEAEEGVVPLEDDERAISDWPGVYIVLGLLFVLFLVIETLGFIVAISTFVFVLSTIFSPDKWLRNLIVSILFSSSIYYMFTSGLGIPLPVGILRGLI